MMGDMTHPATPRPSERGGRQLAQPPPLYAVALAGTFVLASYNAFGAPPSALWRPLVVGIVATLALQIGLTALLRRPHAAAFVTAVVVCLLVLPIVALIVIGALDLWLLLGRLRTGRFAWPQWSRLTGFGNLVALMLVALQVATFALAPAMVPALDAPGDPVEGAPDVYLMMFDGHPRLDTLRDKLGGDPEPFRSQMAALGFDEAQAARSNYNLTFLTLASLFDGAQIDEAISDRTGGLRTVSSAINNGSMLARFRDAGYEIVSIPSPFAQASLEAADRVHDSGQVTEFEQNLLRQGVLRGLLPDLQRQWAMDQHRERILAGFDRLGELAAERPALPRLVFAHFMTPHAPIAFGPGGTELPGPACYPMDCSIWAPPNDELDVQAAQIAYVDSLIVATVREIQQRSARPPVIVVFSDHGYRHDYYDENESLRALLLTSTPGRPGLFPADATPVNYLARIANAYLDTSFHLATEESYWIDVLALDRIGPFAYRPSSP
jgi:hypothetical protein